MLNIAPCFKSTISTAALPKKVSTLFPYEPLIEPLQPKPTSFKASVQTLMLPVSHLKKRALLFWQTLQDHLKHKPNLLKAIQDNNQDLPEPFQIEGITTEFTTQQLNEIQKAQKGLMSLEKGNRWIKRCEKLSMHGFPASYWKQKGWMEVSKGLEDFLSITGVNVKNSCGPVSYTHAQRLGNGRLACAVQHNEPFLAFNTDNQMMIESAEYKTKTLAEQKALATHMHHEFLQYYDINSAGMKHTRSLSELEQDLRQAGNGAQALLFDVKDFIPGKPLGHVTLAVNIQGHIFHIDNYIQHSAIVKPLRAFIQPYQTYYLRQNPEHPLDKPIPENIGNFRYGILNTRVHPLLCGEASWWENTQPLQSIDHSA